MTWKSIQPDRLGDYIDRYVEIVSDFGWDMNDWPDWGWLRGVEDGYVFIQPDDDDEPCENFRDLGGIAIRCIVEARVRMN